ncbi:hypothetical protein HPB52_006664 [Rhipicephalus sanguineus]|uniref:PIK helical domain-containing protein n=1 Tax=Rhipicephalus sanguineus TaxID=34632 RepID=A0A9D4SS31_RHISA|nr:hypothetical protein HPB52_006664 [Rhipicephalus sanguineus]
MGALALSGLAIALIILQKTVRNRERLVPKDLLLRLFESTLFDMPLAIDYLFRSKEPGVLAYLGNRMFSFSDADVDFYLPQIVSMYVHHSDIADSLRPYLVQR